jgi:hypothetical protein
VKLRRREVIKRRGAVLGQAVTRAASGSPEDGNRIDVLSVFRVDLLEKVAPVNRAFLWLDRPRRILVEGKSLDLLNVARRDG